MHLWSKSLLVCLLALLVCLCRESMAGTIRDVSNKNCRFGVVLTQDSIRICGRGPGMPCRAHFKGPILCGEGYFCLCGRCQGCSTLTLSDCLYETTTCVTQ
ncbi:neuroparsin-A-like [Pollicipes pollicipes]|uniref:neuroparsin-A-like n=1 Tax=Pollicipes pollicipes TaxID=41117 RepID=UPI00188523E2|nr:neuroparsin-A-like [Pollicipes pollicipes]